LVSGTPGLIDRINALMTEGAVEPTPSNYEFFYRYVTGADPQLVEAVDAVRDTAGVVGERAISHIRRELYGNGGTGVGRLLEDTERQLARMNDYVERSDADARTYRDRLGSSRTDLDAAATLERQRTMLAEMIEATNTMINTTEQLQNELADSSREIDMLKADLEIARVESRSDALTGLSNRKACCDYLDAQIARATAEERPLSLIFLDIDFFKKFNDNFGHRMGDEVLRLVAQNLERFFHGRGFVSRWGGEEFVIVMPSYDAEEAVAQAELFRQHIATRTVRTRQSGREIGRITLSLGVSELIADDSAQKIIDRADHALYDAKANGRDRVVCWTEKQAA
jgi:diguanylate cyclase